MTPSFPSSSQPIAPIPSWVNPEPLHASSSQGSPQSPYLELYPTTNVLDLLPQSTPNPAQCQASGRLPVPLLGYTRQHAGKAKLVVAGSFTEVQTHSQAILKPSQEETPQKSERAKGHARRAVRVGKSRTKKAASKASQVSEHTTSSWSDGTQSATLPNNNTSATQASPSQGSSTIPATHVGSFSEALPAVRPFLWATATSKEISRLPGLQGIPIKLLDVVLPKLRMSLEGYDDNIHSDTPAAGHEPAIAQLVESLLPTTQPKPSPLTEQFETAFPMAEQNYELGAFNGWEEFMRL